MAMATMAIYLSYSIVLITNYMNQTEPMSIGTISIIRQNSICMWRLFWFNRR